MSKQEDVVEVDKSQQDIMDMKQDIKNLQNDVQKLQFNDIKQDEKIISVQATLSSIQDDTAWIRRKITGAFITALITAVIAGIVGIAITNIF